VRSDVFTADGFYPTGDLGVLDADGYLFFRGRRDDMFKVSGASVYPSEVEAALLAVPEVEKAYVVDVAENGATAVGAVVVLIRGADCGVEQLAAATRTRLSAFKVPVRWALIAPDDVPTTATGKVDQGAIRRLLGDRG
jgi:acyl-CoA synthetase (AMP-forming)/AMP-acid ligase II